MDFHITDNTVCVHDDRTSSFYEISYRRGDCVVRVTMEQSVPMCVDTIIDSGDIRDAINYVQERVNAIR